MKTFDGGGDVKYMTLRFYLDFVIQKLFRSKRQI